MLKCKSTACVVLEVKSLVKPQPSQNLSCTEKSVGIKGPKKKRVGRLALCASLPKNPAIEECTQEALSKIPVCNKNVFKAYLSIDLQDSLALIGDRLLIHAPLSYSVTSPAVCARSYRKPTGDIMTKESENKFHISYLWGCFTAEEQICSKLKNKKNQIVFV